MKKFTFMCLKIKWKRKIYFYILLCLWISNWVIGKKRVTGNYFPFCLFFFFNVTLVTSILFVKEFFFICKIIIITYLLGNKKSYINRYICRNSSTSLSSPSFLCIKQSWQIFENFFFYLFYLKKNTF